MQSIDSTTVAAPAAGPVGGEAIEFALPPARLPLLSTMVALVARSRWTGLVLALGGGAPCGQLLLDWLRCLVFTSGVRSCGARAQAGAAVGLLLGGLVCLIALLQLHAAWRNPALERLQRSGGLLLRLSREGLTATLRGSTLFFDWACVELHQCSRGLLFLAPTVSALFYLPWEQLDRARALQLARLLDARPGAERRLRPLPERLVGWPPPGPSQQEGAPPAR